MELTNVVWTIIGLLIVGLIFTVVMMFKNENTFINHMIITNSIYRYHKDHQDEYPWLVSYSDMEPYNKTTYRIWDWGYTRILPPDKFELIKPYIKK